MTNKPKTGSIDIANAGMFYSSTEVLRNVSLQIEPGSFVTLLGPSGCGKTTLLRLLAGFIDPSSGEIRINGQPTAGLAPQDRPIGMVFQNLALFPHLTVLENVAYGLKLRRRPAPEIAQRVERFLDLVGLRGYEARRINQLSGGQKQRVALARSLVLEPSILLLDEPLSALDLQLKKQLQYELKRIQRSLDTTFIYVTHDQEEATVMSDTIVVMNKGEVQQVGSPRQIYEKPHNFFVSRFIGDINALEGKVVAAGDGVAEIRSPAGVIRLPLQGRQAAALQQGAECMICFRLEDVAIAASDTLGDQAIQFDARVADVLTLGAVARISLDVGQAAITALLMTHDLGAGLAQPGGTCRLKIAPEKIHVFPGRA